MRIELYIIAIGEMEEAEQKFTVSSLSAFLKKTSPEVEFSNLSTYLANFAQENVLVRIAATEGRRGIQYSKGANFATEHSKAINKLESLLQVPEKKAEFTARLKSPEERELRAAYELVCAGEIKRIDFYALVCSQMLGNAESFTARDMQQHLLETIPELKDMYSNLPVFLNNMCDGKEVLSLKDDHEQKGMKRSYQRGNKLEEALAKIKPLLLARKSEGFERLAVC